MINENNPIPLITPDNPAANSGDVVGENVASLKALFPQIVTDGKVDFEVLRQLLGDAMEEGEERYGLSWKGKARARAHALTPTLATLRPAKEDSVDWDTTQNLLIEGDNLEVLKTLRKAYAGKVKLIYIDPPYNTGKDFVYPDNYTDSLSNYMELTGQLGADGAQLTSNKEASGRFHTDWLNMMYPRLVLSQDLLSDDGVILVSINDGEVAALNMLMSEIFGQNRFVSNLIWKSRQNKDNRSDNGVSVDHEYLVCFGRKFRGEDRKIEGYTNSDNDPRGPWTSGNMVGLATPDRRPNLHYDLINPADGLNYGCPPLGWRYEPKSMAKLIDEGRILWPSSPDGRPRRKTFLADLDSDFTGFSSIVGRDVFTRNGTADIDALFDERVFDFPKPKALIAELIKQTTESGDVVFDFFAGSGTTGHSVMAQNVADGGNRRFILAQLPEPLNPSNRDQKFASGFCDKMGKPRNIAELTKERLRRAGAKIKADHPDRAVDTGFRVYKLDSSNLKPWQPDPDNLEVSLLDAVSNILHGRSEEDLFVELLLKTGIDLTTPTKVRQIAGKDVHALGGGALIVCLADINDNEAEQLGHCLADWQVEIDPAGQTTFYFKDTGFASASAKANVAAILRQRLGDKIAKLASI